MALSAKEGSSLDCIESWAARLTCHQSLTVTGVFRGTGKDV